MRTPQTAARPHLNRCTGAAVTVLLSMIPFTSAGAQEAPPAGPSAAEARAAIEAPQPGAEPGSLGELTLEQLLDSLNVPGLSLAVVHGFEVHWARGYGVRDASTGAPVDAETIFQAASISKPVAAMASLKAVQDNLFGLDQDINTILTSWQLDGEGLTDRRPVTPRMLMSHTSGLGDGFGYPGYEPETPLPTAVQTLDGHPSSNTRPLFMEREPMTAFEYSGGGVTLQQVALSDARGRPFAEVLWSDVLAPIGMTRSSFSQPMPPPREDNAAAAHDGNGERKGEARWHIYPEQAAAGLWTTAEDLARFLVEVQLSIQGASNRVLDRAHAREMITPVGIGDYAIGFGLRRGGPGWYFGHGGSNWGFRGDIMAHLSNGYGLAQLTNGDRGGELMGEIRSRVARVYGWDVMAEPVPRGYRPAAERTEVDLPAEDLQKLEGTYELATDAPVVIDNFEGRLRFRAEGEQPFPMFAASPTEFWLAGADATLTFVLAGGEARGFTLYSGGTQRTWIRAR